MNNKMKPRTEAFLNSVVEFQEDYYREREVLKKELHNVIQYKYGGDFSLLMNDIENSEDYYTTKDFVYLMNSELEMDY